jgi:lipid-A-disaccharide synthase
MAQIIDRLLVIFPFEKEIFDGTGLHVDFVGHPLVETIRRLKESRQEELPWRGVKRVALLPGSRRQEVERILPSIWEAARLLEEKDPGISFILATPSSVIESIARNTISNITKNPERVEFVVGKTRHVLWQAQAAIVASGTATIEAALMRCPMVIVYCVSGITYWLGRKLIKIPYIGMVNIVADRELCPEFIQHDADPVRIAAAMGVILKDGSKRENMLAGLDSVADKLSVENAIEKSAAVILDELGLSAS